MIKVEVARHFNEDAFSYGLATGLADRIREALHGVRCSEHDDEIAVRVSTEGVAQTLNDLHVDISGCCPAAIARVQAVVDRIGEVDVTG